MILRCALAAATITAAFGLGGCHADSEGALAVVITMPEHGLVGAAKTTVLVDYSGTGASIVREKGGVSCAFILPGLDGDFSDDGQGELTVRVQATRPPRALTDIAACRMSPTDLATTAADLQGELVVRVSAAEDASGKAIDMAASGSKAKRSRSGDSDPRSVETAQAEAVKAAAAAFPSAPKAPVAAADAGAGKPAGTMPGAPNTGAAGPASSGATAAAGRAATAGAGRAAPAAPGSGLPTGQDPANNGAIPVKPDADPGYDDSVSDDERAPAYDLDIAVQGSTPFGALQFEVTHLGSNGGFIGREDKIDCVPLVEAIVAGNYVGERIARLGLISLQGIGMNQVILRCGFRTRESLSNASFLIKVTDASDTKSDPLDPEPTVSITSVSRR